ncbi:unnamed protein product, partial [Rotaria sp. Silwood1]
MSAAAGTTRSSVVASRSKQ